MRPRRHPRGAVQSWPSNPCSKIAIMPSLRFGPPLNRLSARRDIGSLYLYDTLFQSQRSRMCTTGPLVAGVFAALHLHATESTVHLTSAADVGTCPRGAPRVQRCRLTLWVHSRKTPLFSCLSVSTRSGCRCQCHLRTTVIPSRKTPLFQTVSCTSVSTRSGCLRQWHLLTTVPLPASPHRPCRPPPLCCGRPPTRGASPAFPLAP